MRRRFLGKMRGLPLKCLTTFVILHSGYLSGLAVWGIERSVFLLVGENGRKTLKTNRFRHGMGNGQNISKRFPFT